jgi:hypothetical protein
MRAALAVLLLMLTASGAAAQNHPLQGQWQVRSTPTYTAVMIVDSDGRTIYDAPRDAGRPAKFFGYVKSVDDIRAHIVETNRTNVTHTHCTILSSDLLDCQTTREDGGKSPRYLMVRTGPGPDRLQAPTHL